MDFLKAYELYTSAFESPTSFWKWSSYSIISAVLRDNVHMRYGVNVIYPNIYVLLLAESAMHRKGAPVTLAERLLERIGNTKILSGRASVQGLIDGLKTNETDDKGKLQKGGSAICLLPEMAAGLVQDVSAIQILTDIYDFKAKYTNRLRTTGEFKIERLVFSILAGSNIDMLNELFTTSAVYGGFLGRTFVVKPDEQRPANALLVTGDLEKQEDNLYKILKEISYLKGLTTFTPGASRMYENWYTQFRDKSFKTKDNLGIGKTGVNGRIHTGILKIAIIMAANKLSLVVDEDVMGLAIADCLMLLENYREFVGRSSSVTQQGIVAQALLSDLLSKEYDGEISHKEFLFHHLDKIEGLNLQQAIATLEAAKIIEVCTGATPVYKLTAEGRERLTKQFEGPKKEMIQ